MRFMDIHDLIEETLRCTKFSKKLLLIRHGTSLGNITPRIHGSSEYPLTPKGEAQAEELGMHLRKYVEDIVQIRSSNLVRSLETCRIAMQMSVRKDLYDKFLIDPRIKEFGFGIWENTPLSPDVQSKDLEVLYSCLMKGQIRPFNGDDVDTFQQSLWVAFNEALPDGLNLYFTHSGVIYTATKEIDDKFFIGQCGVAAFVFDDFTKERHLVGVCDGTHEHFV
jgi:broad specificity phosphatase PhoE